MSEIRPDALDFADPQEVLRNATRAIQQYDQIAAASEQQIEELGAIVIHAQSVADDVTNARAQRRQARRDVEHFTILQRTNRGELEKTHATIANLQAELNAYYAERDGK